MPENVILRKDESKEDWWQPELHCEKCGCSFMWSSHPNFSEYPTFCPNCGKKFTGLRVGTMLILDYTKERRMESDQNDTLH